MNEECYKNEIYSDYGKKKLRSHLMLCKHIILIIGKLYSVYLQLPIFKAHCNLF